MTHLFGDLYAEALYSGDQWRLTAGVQHSLLNRTLVSRHGVNKHYNYKTGEYLSVTQGSQQIHHHFFLTLNVKSKFLHTLCNLSLHKINFPLENFYF